MRSTQLSRIDLNLLLVADALLESRSVTATARAVHLSQPAVSRALGRLREQLDNPLLVRDGRSMVLTPFAADLRPRLRRALLDLERSVFSGSTFNPATSSDTFTIASQDFAAFSHVPDVLRTLSERAPRVRLVVRAYREPFESLLETGDVDLVVGPRAAEKSWIRSELLFESGWACLAAKGHPYLRKPSLKRFCASPQVLVSPRGDGPGPVDDALARLGQSRKVRARFADFAGALAVVAQTDMLMVAPRALADTACRILPIAARELPFELAPTRVFVSWHLARGEEPRHAWLVDQVRRRTVRSAARS